MGWAQLTPALVASTAACTRVLHVDLDRGLGDAELGADLLVAAGPGELPADYLGLALCTANPLLMKAPMITTMGPALSTIVRALCTSQWSVGVVGKGT